MTNKNSIYSKDAILVMIASFFFMFSGMYCNPIMNGFAESLGASSAFAGLIVGIMNIFAMLLRPIAGNLTDLLSKYRLAFIGGLLCLLGNLGYILAPNSVFLMGFRIIYGTGYVFCTVCMSTWISYLVPFSHVGQAMGFYGIMNALAIALAPAMSISLYSVIGYRYAIIIPTIASLLMIILIQFVSQRINPSAKQKANVKSQQHFQIIQKDSLPAAILIALFSLPYFATQADIVSYTSNRHITVAIEMYFIIYAIVLLVIRMIFRNQFDTVHFGTWLVIGTVAALFYLGMLTIMRNNWEMILAAAGMAASFGIMFSVCQSTALMMAPESQRGLASSTFYLGLDIGMGFGPIVGGLISNYLPLKYYYPVMMITIPLILIVYWVNRHQLNSAIDNH